MLREGGSLELDYLPKPRWNTTPSWKRVGKREGAKKTWKNGENSDCKVMTGGENFFNWSLIHWYPVSLNRHTVWHQLLMSKPASTTHASG